MHDIKNKVLSVLKKYGIITLGCLIYSAGISMFVTQSDLSSGGMTGISIIVNHFVPQISQGLWLLILNIPMLIIGLICFGKGFIISTAYATALSSLAMAGIKQWGTNGGWLPLTDGIAEPSATVINAVVGGVLFGVGMALIFRMGATTAGTDIIVKLLRKKFRHIPTGIISLVSDMTIICCSYFTNFDLEKLFYTAISTVVFTFVFDRILYGGNSAKTVRIITDKDKYERIIARIFEELDTGATLVEATGAYTGENKMLIICVVKPFSYPVLRDVVKEEDKKAFMIVSSAKEIYGEGYKDQNAEEV